MYLYHVKTCFQCPFSSSFKIGFYFFYASFIDPCRCFFGLCKRDGARPQGFPAAFCVRRNLLAAFPWYIVTCLPAGMSQLCSGQCTLAMNKISDVFQLFDM